MPSTLEGKEYGFIFPGWHFYATIDKSYVDGGRSDGDGFALAQSIMNLVEACIQVCIVQLGSAHTSAVCALLGSYAVTWVLADIRSHVRC